MRRIPTPVLRNDNWSLEELFIIHGIIGLLSDQRVIQRIHVLNATLSKKCIVITFQQSNTRQLDQICRLPTLNLIILLLFLPLTLYLSKVYHFQDLVLILLDWIHHFPYVTLFYVQKNQDDLGHFIGNVKAVPQVKNEV